MAASKSPERKERPFNSDFMSGAEAMKSMIIIQLKKLGEPYLPMPTRQLLDIVNTAYIKVLKGDYE